MNFKLWETHFTYKGDTKLYCGGIWVITNFVRKIGNDELLFIIQPAMIKQGKVVGATGLHAYIVNMEELHKNFEAINPSTDTGSVEVLKKYLKKLNGMTDEEVVERLEELGVIEYED